MNTNNRTQQKKEATRKKIRFNILFSSILHLTALIIFTIIGAAIYFFTKPTEGFALRVSIIIGIVAISYVVTTAAICRKDYLSLKRLISKDNSK